MYYTKLNMSLFDSPTYNLIKVNVVPFVTEIYNKGQQYSQYSIKSYAMNRS